MIEVTGARVHIIPVNHRGNWVLVEVESADHHRGWGEASDSKNDSACIEAIRRCVEDLKGKDIDPIATADTLIEGVPNERLSRTAPSAISQALYDLSCRKEGISVAEKLSQGHQIPNTVKFYCNINRKSSSRDPASIAAAGCGALEAGCTNIKIAPFDEVSPRHNPADVKKLVGPGVARLRALRDAVGARAQLMIDCHWRFTKETAPLLAAICKDLEITWIEDPLHNWDKSACDELRAISGGRICGGENFYTHTELENLAKSGCIDVLIADVKFTGGPGRLNEICKMAATYGLKFAPHNPSGPICTAASAQVTAANRNAEILEYAFGEVPWRLPFAKGENPLGTEIAVKGPGLGIDIDFDSQGKPAH
tara:strand:- start:1316 stop:2416 length:1101 start_codon:yes stop_codon:yes gene_type:complete